MLNTPPPPPPLARLNLVVLRLAHVYGPYDSKYVGTALSLARVYQQLGKELKWLWTKDLRVNTVHVTDVARALWIAAEWNANGKAGWDGSWGDIPVFNVVDHGDTCEQPQTLTPLFFTLAARPAPSTASGRTNHPLRILMTATQVKERWNR